MPPKSRKTTRIESFGQYIRRISTILAVGKLLNKSEVLCKSGKAPGSGRHSYGISAPFIAFLPWHSRFTRVKIKHAPIDTASGNSSKARGTGLRDLFPAGNDESDSGRNLYHGQQGNHSLCQHSICSPFGPEPGRPDRKTSPRHEG